MEYLYSRLSTVSKLKVSSPVKKLFSVLTILSLFTSIGMNLLIANTQKAYSATTVTVRPSNMQGWSFVQEVANGTGSLVSGPSTVPNGAGSARLTVDGTGRELLLNTSYAGTRLDSITSLSYSSYNITSGSIFAPTLQLDIDYNLNDANNAWQGRLVYEPYYNGTVSQSVWQNWDALLPTAKWWASGAPGNTICTQASGCLLSTLLAAYPNAGIRAAVGNIQFKVGGAWAGGFEGNVDGLTIGIDGEETIYDFEEDLAVVEAPVLTGWKLVGESIDNNPTIACVAQPNAAWANNSDRRVDRQVWDAVSGTNIKYYRQVREISPSLGSWIILNSPAMVYSAPYMTGSNPFTAADEGKIFETQVKAFSDLNNNNQVDAGETESPWSNSCNIGYDTVAPVLTYLGFRDQSSAIYDSTQTIKPCTTLAQINSTGFMAWEWEMNNTSASTPVTYTYTIVSGPTAIGFTATTTNTYYNGAIPAEGTYDVEVFGTDAAGNKSNVITCSVNYISASNIVSVQIDDAFAKIQNGYACGIGSAFDNDGLRVTAANWEAGYKMQGRYYTNGGALSAWIDFTTGNVFGQGTLTEDLVNRTAEFVVMNTGDSIPGAAGWEVRVVDSTNAQIGNTDNLDYTITTDADSLACNGIIELGFETAETGTLPGIGQCTVYTNDLSAANGTASLEILKWDAVNDAIYYVLNGYFWNGTSWEVQYADYTVPNSDLVFENGIVIYNAYATPEGRFAYLVRAYDANNNLVGQSPIIDTTDDCSFTVDRTGSAQPLFWVEEDTSSVKIDWKAVTGAEIYNIYRNGSLLGTSTTTTYTDTTAVANTDYTYEVRSSDLSGNESVAQTAKYAGTKDIVIDDNALVADVNSSGSVGSTGGWAAYSVDTVGAENILQNAVGGDNFSINGSALEPQYSWTTASALTGIYEVYVSYICDSSRGNASYNISNGGNPVNTSEIIVDQSTNGSGDCAAQDSTSVYGPTWISLGQYTFTSNGGVTLTAKEGQANIIADAVSFRYTRPLTSSFNVCKEDENGNRLPGWEMNLSQTQTSSIDVPSNGNIVTTDILPAGTYTVLASGTYAFWDWDSSTPEIDGIADAGYSYRPNGTAGYPDFNPGTEPAWISGDDLTGYEGALEVKINGQNINWGPFDTDHMYTYSYTHAGGPITFNITDSSYSDNSGSINITLSSGQNESIITDSDGCALFEDVAFGEYYLTETMQDGWEAVSDDVPSPLIVDQFTEGMTYTFVNRLIVTPSPTPTVTPELTITPEVTPTITIEPTITPEPSVTPEITPTVTVEPTITITVEPTLTTTPEPTITVEPTTTLTPTITVTIEPTLTVTPTLSPSITVQPSLTPSPTVTISPTVTSIPSVTPSVSPTLTVSPTTVPSATVIPTTTPTVTTTQPTTVVNSEVTPTVTNTNPGTNVPAEGNVDLDGVATGPVVQNQITSTPSPTGAVLGTTVKVVRNGNYFEVEADKGQVVEIDGADGLCEEFHGLTFKTLSNIKGRVFIKTYDKETYKNLPFDDKKVTFMVCELVLDGIKNSDITDIVLKTKYTEEWLNDTKLKTENLRVYVAKDIETKLSDKVDAKKVDDVKIKDKEYDVLESKLKELPTVFAIAPDFLESVKAESDNGFPWWMIICGGLLLLAVIIFLIILIRNRNKRDTVVASY